MITSMRPTRAIQPFFATFFSRLQFWTNGCTAWSTTHYLPSLFHGCNATNYRRLPRAMVAWCLQWMITSICPTRAIQQRFTTFFSRPQNWTIGCTDWRSTLYLPSLFYGCNATNYHYPLRATVAQCPCLYLNTIYIYRRQPHGLTDPPNNLNKQKQNQLTSINHHTLKATLKKHLSHASLHKYHRY